MVAAADRHACVTCICQPTHLHYLRQTFLCILLHGSVSLTALVELWVQLPEPREEAARRTRVNIDLENDRVEDAAQQRRRSTAHTNKTLENSAWPIQTSHYRMQHGVHT